MRGKVSALAALVKRNKENQKKEDKKGEKREEGDRRKKNGRNEYISRRWFFEKLNLRYSFHEKGKHYAVSIIERVHFTKPIKTWRIKATEGSRGISNRI